MIHSCLEPKPLHNLLVVPVPNSFLELTGGSGDQVYVRSKLLQELYHLSHLLARTLPAFGVRLSLEVHELAAVGLFEVHKESLPHLFFRVISPPRLFEYFHSTLTHFVLRSSFHILSSSRRPARMLGSSFLFFECQSDF